VTTAHSEVANPGRWRAAARRPLPLPAGLPFEEPEFFERDRDEDAGLLFDRDAPDRPAGRFVAVVTVSNRVVPERPDQGDTGRS
jgi:hypothetical protein